MDKPAATPAPCAAPEPVAIALRVENVTKTYRLYDRHADRVKETFHPFKRRYHRPFYALQGVCFSLPRGEVCGIVGRNGSGKSTLLEIVCGVLKPTDGQVSASGRVSALLELGAGFNPDFTGRQNVYLNAQILGLQPEEIDTRMGDILAFADIGTFIDQAVKTYSSGMYLRLAFAVAVNVMPDILVVDEALAVGDALFQRKCIARIHEIRRGGGTILLVSHDAATVIELCDRVILLDQGEKLIEGRPREVVAHYHKLLFAPPEAVGSIREEIRRAAARQAPQPPAEEAVCPPSMDAPKLPDYDPHLVPTSTLDYPSRGARIARPRIESLTGEVVNVLCGRQEYVYTYTVDFSHAACGARFGMLIKTVTGVRLGGFVSAPRDSAIDCIAAGQTAHVRFRFTCLLKPGVYFLNAGVMGTVDGEEIYLHRIVDAVSFRVLPDRRSLMTGLVDFYVEPTIYLGASTCPGGGGGG